MPITPLRLTEIGALRLQALSFFIVLFFVLAVVVRFIWNGLARDIPALPRLSYWRALGLLFIWGLLMSVVLTMISGARELMTPGAWERVGATYKLTPGQPQGQVDPWMLARQRRLAELAAELITYAQCHDGHFPPHRFVPEVRASAWDSLAPDKSVYEYLPTQRYDAAEPVPTAEGHQSAKATLLVAYEPAWFGDQRWCLLSDGSVVLLGAEDVWRRVNAQTLP